MDAFTFSSLVLAPDAGEPKTLSDPFPVLYVGNFKRPDFPKDGINVTAADLDHAVEVFNETFAPIGGVPIDLDHSFAEGREAPAMGWIKQLWRSGDKLMCRAEWTDEGSAEIASGRYRLFSPEFSTDWTDEQGKARGFTLLAGGITNRPFLKGLQPVALSDTAREYVAAEAQQLSSLAVGGIVPAAKPVTVTLTAPVTLTPKDARVMTEPTVTAKDVEDLTASLNEVRATVETLQTENKTLSERADTAEADAAATKKELADERLNVVLSQARREGRIDAKDETTAEFADLADKLGLDGVKAILAKIPAETIPVSEQGHGRDKATTASDAPEGVDPASYALHVRTEEIAAEKDIPYEQAASLAFKEAQV